MPSPHRTLLAANGRRTGIQGFPHTKSINFSDAGDNIRSAGEQAIGIANSFTVLFWIERSANFATPNLLNLDQAAGNNSRIFCRGRNTDEFDFLLFDNAGSTFKSFITTDSPIAVSTKYQIGCTFNGTDMVLILDGAAKTTGITKNTDVAGTMSDDSRPIIVGDNGAQDPNTKISALYFWNTVLGASSLSATYNSGTGYQLDLRDSQGSYTETANLKHMYALGNNPTLPGLGEDLVATSSIDLDTLDGIDTSNIETF